MTKTSLKSRLILIFSIVFLTTFVFTGTSCRLLKHDKQAAAEKKQADAKKASNAEYEKALKHHYDIQNKETKKMMKRTKKKADKNNKPKKHGLFGGPKCS
jgi:hypothetical protein